MSDKKESVDTTIKMVTATIDKYYHGIITSLQSQLEREQKCVDVSVEALEKLKLGWLYWPANRQPDPRITMYESKDLHQIEKMAYEAITKIKSLREQK